jgi:apolipoprotein N-acyltransferase
MLFKTLLTNQRSLLLSFVGGLLYAAGFPMFFGHSIFFAPFIGFLIFNIALSFEEMNFKRQMLCAFIYSLGFYLLGFYWIPYTLQEFGSIPFPLNYLLGLAFSLFIIPQFYFFTWAKKKFSNPLTLSIIFVLLEEFIPQQFPAHLGHSFISLTPTIPLKLAPLFGSCVYSFLTVYLALNIIQHYKTKIAPKISYALIALMVILNFTGIAPINSKLIAKLNLRIVQPNIGNFIKIDSERGSVNSLKSVFDSYYELSTKPNLIPIDLVIWPETSFPSLLVSDVLKAKPDLKIPELLSQIIDKTHSDLFIGGYDLKPSTNYSDYQSQYNAAFLFSQDKKLKDVYRKMKLIPFGEGLPFGPLNHFLSKYITNVSFFAEGDNYTLFETKNGVPFSSAICYEILFPHFIRNLISNKEKSPQFLINLTNDSWYGNTAEPHQHLFLAKWRSLEFNLPIVRATNTGITTIINRDASESIRINYNEKTSFDLPLEIFERSPTLFERLGVFMILILAALFFGAEVLAKKFKL